MRPETRFRLALAPLEAQPGWDTWAEAVRQAYAWAAEHEQPVPGIVDREGATWRLRGESYWAKQKQQ